MNHNGCNEIRLDRANKLDDIVIQCDSVHFERMDDNWFWLALYRDDERITFAVTARPDGTIDVVLDEDDLGIPIIVRR